MPLAEAPPNEAGDDRSRQVEIQRLNELYYVTDAKEPDVEEQAAPGELIAHYANKFGAPTLRRANVMLATDKPIIHN